MTAAPTARELVGLRRDTGYPVDTLEVTARLLDVLQAIARDPVLGGRVALTGGTALNAFHSRWPRLSVDIDLTYMGPPGWDAVQVSRSRGNDALRRILVDLGYEILREPANAGGGKWRAGFDAHFADDPRLEIDLGYVDRQPLFDPARMSSAPLGDSVVTDMLVLDRREVVATKLRALFSRRRGRDLFDAIEILSAGDLDWRGVRAAFLAYCAASRRDLRDISVDRIGADPAEIGESLEGCLPAGFFSETPVGRWIDESIEGCRQGLAHLLAWTEDERAFIDGVRERGEIDARLLDAPSGLRARIAAMPQLHWRCGRVREAKAAPLPFAGKASGRPLSF